jgi:hypothetical protein
VSCGIQEIRQAFGRLDLVAGQLAKRTLVVHRDDEPALFSPAFEDWVVGEVFDLVGTADHDFQSWLGQQSVQFSPPAREILPHVNAEHRLWVGKWLSDKDGSRFLDVIRCLIDGG